MVFRHPRLPSQRCLIRENDNPRRSIAHIHIAHADVIAVIDMARTHELLSLLPSAFYLAAQLPNEVLVEGHKDGDGRRWSLSSRDLVATLNGMRRLRTQDLKQMEYVIETRPGPQCVDEDKCRAALASYRSELLREQDDMPFGPPAPLMDCDTTPGLCPPCVETYDKAVSAGRKAIWNTLPELFDIKMDGLQWPAPEQGTDDVEG